MDQDYTERLSPGQKQWLAEFNDRYYGADFRGEAEMSWSTEDRRSVYRDKNRANRDLMTCALPVDVEVPDETVEMEELVYPNDGRLDGAKYKAAREAYRADPSPANRVRLNQARRR